MHISIGVRNSDNTGCYQPPQRSTYEPMVPTDLYAAAPPMEKARGWHGNHGYLNAGLAE